MRHRDVPRATLCVECFEDLGKPFLGATGATLSHVLLEPALRDLQPRLLAKSLVCVSRYLQSMQRDRGWQWRHGSLSTDSVLVFRDGSLAVTQWAPEGQSPWPASPNADMYYFARFLRDVTQPAVWNSSFVQSIVTGVQRSSFVGRRWVTPFGRTFGMPFKDEKVPKDLDALRPDDTVMATVELAACNALVGLRRRIVRWRRATRESRALGVIV